MVHSVRNYHSEFYVTMLCTGATLHTSTKFTVFLMQAGHNDVLMSIDNAIESVHQQLSVAVDKSAKKQLGESLKLVL